MRMDSPPTALFEVKKNFLKNRAHRGQGTERFLLTPPFTCSQLSEELSHTHFPHFPRIR